MSFLRMTFISKRTRFVSKQGQPQPHVWTLKGWNTKLTSVKWSISFNIIEVFQYHFQMPVEIVSFPLCEFEKHTQQTNKQAGNSFFSRLAQTPAAVISPSTRSFLDCFLKNNVNKNSALVYWETTVKPQFALIVFLNSRNVQRTVLGRSYSSFVWYDP